MILPSVIIPNTTGWGPRSLLRSVGLFLWLNYMVYGRYITIIVFMGIISWFINQLTSLGVPILYQYYLYMFNLFSSIFLSAGRRQGICCLKAFGEGMLRKNIKII